MAEFCCGVRLLLKNATLWFKRQLAFATYFAGLGKHKLRLSFVFFCELVRADGSELGLQIPPVTSLVEKL